MAFSQLEALQMTYCCGFLNSEADFIFVFSCSYMSICTVSNIIKLLLAGYDVMLFSSLGVAAGDL